VRRETPGTGAGHREGRAVDVGVPDTEEGFNYVVNAIRSGQFQKIGTNPRWIPVLQNIAQQYGVMLFPDYREIHAHLEVSP
jgi:hypothetical protein